MKGKEEISTGTGARCEPNDLVSQKSGLLLWCLPTVALFVGLAWRDQFALFWIPAFLIMGIGCLVNARHCGRMHCYFTGPVFVFAAIYVALAAADFLPIRLGMFLGAVLALALLACLAEIPLGKYRKRA